MDSIAEILELADEYENELPAQQALPPVPPGAQIAGWIDHTLLKPEATSDQIDGLCNEARKESWCCVCP